MTPRTVAMACLIGGAVGFLCAGQWPFAALMLLLVYFLASE